MATGAAEIYTLSFSIPDLIRREMKLNEKDDSGTHKSFFLTPGLFFRNQEISAPPPWGFLIGRYLFYENWSAEFSERMEPIDLFNFP
jgi:hypothetical protein